MTTPFQSERYEDVSMSGLSVMIGMPTHRDLHPKTVLALVETVLRCHKLQVPCRLEMVISGVVMNGRDDVLDAFLKSDANRLFWIDSDMTWTPDQFVRLLALSKLVAIVGAAYPAKLDQPTFFVKFDEQNGMDKNEYGLLAVEGVGLGFTVLQREPLEKLAANAEDVLDEISGRTVKSVFRWDRFEGKRRGEDMAFFSDLRALGYSVFLDPMIDLGHIGTKEYSGSIRNALRSL